MVCRNVAVNGKLLFQKFVSYTEGLPFAKHFCVFPVP